MNECLAEHNPKVTLCTTILRQEDGSWQGEVKWMEGKRSGTFRNSLEMIMMIDKVCEISAREYEKKKTDAG